MKFMLNGSYNIRISYNIPKYYFGKIVIYFILFSKMIKFGNI